MGSILSLNEAAERAGLSRWPVSRALQAGRLRGIRDNRGRWRIEAADLDAWAAEQPRTVPHEVPHDVQHGAKAEPHRSGTVPALAIEVATLRAKLEAAEARAVEFAQERVEFAREREEVRAERDRWRMMAERLVECEAERPTSLQPEVQPRPGLLARLFGQGRPRPA
jgi:excisionase family DNA binding protein